jgi:hypothetical protein
MTRTILFTFLFFLNFNLHSAQANECKVWIAESKINHRVLEPMLTASHWNPTFAENDKFLNGIPTDVKKDDLVLQIDYSHHRKFTSPFTSVNDCTIDIRLSRVVDSESGALQFEPIIHDTRANLGSFRGQSNQQKACNAALTRVMNELESCEAYRDHRNTKRMFFNAPTPKLEKIAGLLYWELWNENMIPAWMDIFLNQK